MGASEHQITEQQQHGEELQKTQPSDMQSETDSGCEISSQIGEEDIAVEVHDLTVSYQTRPVLWNIDFVVPKGHLVAVIGPNGAGKTTLIKAIMGLLPLSSGWVKIFNRSYELERLRVGYVPQRESVDWDFPTTVLDVVIMGRYGRLGWFRRPGRAERDIALRCIEKVGMTQYIDRQISQLSGGQQQRVFLARALAQEADLYLMDEPFAGVDAVTEKSIVALLRELRSQGKTVLVVHHDLQTVSEYFDWVLLVKKTYGGQLPILSQAADAISKGK
jgi:manganese/zinc/iron transport system ATP- binding protein